jgi:hypothetical protein
LSLRIVGSFPESIAARAALATEKAASNCLPPLTAGKPIGNVERMIAVTDPTAILALIFSCLALLVSWKTYRRDTAKQTRDDEKEILRAEPNFVWAGGAAAYDSATTKMFIADRDFTNKGGAVSNVSINVNKGLEANIRPTLHLSENQTGKIDVRINGQNFAPVNFKISYETRLGHKGEQRFDWKTVMDDPKRVKP